MHFIAFRDPLLLLAVATSSTPHRSAAVRLVKKWTPCRWQIPRGSAEINKTKLDSSTAPLLPGERERAWLHGAADGESAVVSAPACVVVVLVLYVGAGGETLQCLGSCISASPTVRDAFTASACLLRDHLTAHTDMNSSWNWAAGRSH